MTDRRAWLPVAAVLAVVYLATLAPSVTFWDAGEFIAAGHSLGIPHPPGTPLFILLLHTWGLPWPDAMTAVGSNLFSAVSTVAAAALSASLIERWMRRTHAPALATASAIAGGICAGAMYTAWSNATETEVYGTSLALAIVILFAAERRHRVLVAYCFGLAAALHVSALVAAPAAIMLATTDDDGRFDWSDAALLGAAALAAMAIGTWSGTLAILAGVSGIIAVCHPVRGEGSVFRMLPSRSFAALRMTAVVLLGASPLLFMLVRAGFDPAINQGNPETLQAWIDVIARRQYDLAPLWPRRAPVWIQLGNWFEFADWQVALSLAPDVVPTIPRTLTSIVFGGLAIAGAAFHRRADRRSWFAMLVLFLAGTIGVAGYLNLRASPSFGWGVLPDDTLREARERDYFFILGFWVSGLWAGLGAVALALRYRRHVAVGVAVAALPIALNWSAVNRRAAPDSTLALLVAHGLVETLPERAVLFVAGDNDTYPVWFAREALGLRPDVTLVTVPLVGADWYSAELIRRNPDLAAARTSNGINTITIADAARAEGRPVVASLTLDRADRVRLNGCWRVIGLGLLDAGPSGNCLYDQQGDTAVRFGADTVALQQWINRVLPTPLPPAKPSVDGVANHFARVLNCPRGLLENARKNRGIISLDSTCKL